MKKLIIPVILLLQFTWSCSYSGQEPNQDVIQAFNLRMEGKAGQALALLDSILILDSTNALAHFERSRVLTYMLTGGGNVPIESIPEALRKAVSYDSTNVIYAYDLAMASFLEAYIALEQGEGEAAPLVENACAQFKKVLKLKSDTPEAMLELVEIYGLLPAALGGDSLQAVSYAAMLKKRDDFYGAKAELVLGSEDPLLFWNDYLATHDTTPEVLREIGVGYLYAENPQGAEEVFRLMMAKDPAQNILLLDLARYYQFLVMQNRNLADSLLPISAKYIAEYLESEPLPVIPLRAYATGMLVKTKIFTGKKEEGEALMEQAKALDPWFSRAFGIPGSDLFVPPDQATIRFSSFFRPF